MNGDLLPRSSGAREIWHQFDALRLGMDFTEEDLEKPQILIEDAYGESHPGSYHLDELSGQVGIGVYESGGRPVHFHATDLCDGWAQGHDGMNYILASREVLADMVELHGSVIPWDGMVLLSSCDKSVPAHLMGAARLDLPAIHMPGGSMRASPRMSTSGKAGETSLRAKRGEIPDAEVREYKLTGCPTCGACQFMGTASTMQCMAEALGMALPGSALCPSTMQDILRLSRHAGKRVMDLARRAISAGEILADTAFENAIKVHAAIGGSTNALLHLPAIAHEREIALAPERFQRANDIVPYLTDVQPSGRYVTELMWFAGGVPRVQWEIRDLLDLNALTVTGRTLGENLEHLHRERFFDRAEGYLANYGLRPEDVIRPRERAKETGSLAILKGSLAPEGAVVKYAAVAPEMRHHMGPAAVFDREEDAHDAIAHGKVSPGAVIVIRYEGPKGSGMPEMFMTTDALMGMPELASTTAIVTDGRFSGASRGPCIGHVSPEAAEGGPLALIEDGDLIEIDIQNGRLDIVGLGGKRADVREITRALDARRKTWRRPEPKAKRGVLARYIRSAVSGMAGGYWE